MRSITRSVAGVSRVAAATSAARTAYPSIAERANGGTSIAENTSDATTRPPASISATRCVRSIGRTFACRRRRASSSEIVEANGRILLARLLDQMSELRQQQALHGEAHRLLRPWQADDDASGGEPGAGAAHHRRRSDLVEAEPAEEFAESVETLLQDRRHRLVRAIARGDAGAAGRDDDFDVGVCQLPFDGVAHELGLVLHDRASGDAVSRAGEQIGDRASALVGLFGARVADGQHEAADR